MRKLILIYLALLCFFSLDSNAQEKAKRSYGLSATIQDNQFGLLIPFWLSDKTTIAPAIDIKYADGVGSDITLGIVPKFYINTEKVVPYVSLKIGVMISSPSSDNKLTTKKTTDLLFGVAYGGEYFFDDHFSIGIELEGNFTKSDKNSSRFGNPDGINFNTATLVSANIYF
jgi:hypothetical protein